MRPLAVDRGAALALAAAISRAAEGAAVSGRITRRPRWPGTPDLPDWPDLPDSDRTLCGSGSAVHQPTFTTWPLTKTPGAAGQPWWSPGRAVAGAGMAAVSKSPETIRAARSERRR